MYLPMFYQQNTGLYSLSLFRKRLSNSSQAIKLETLLSSPVTPQSWEVRCSKKHNTLTQLKLEPRPLDLEFEWSPQKPQGHIISQLPSPLHKETVELGTTEDLRTIISLERFLLQDKRNNNKTNNNGAFLTKALNKGSNLVEPLYSHSDRLSIWNSICNNETKTVFALTCQIQH